MLWLFTHEDTHCAAAPVVMVAVHRVRKRERVLLVVFSIKRDKANTIIQGREEDRGKGLRRKRGREKGMEGQGHGEKRGKTAEMIEGKKSRREQGKEGKRGKEGRRIKQRK